MKRKTFNGLWLDVRAASEVLGCSERSLRWHVDRGLVPHRRLGNRILFKRSELETVFETLPGVTLADVRANLKTRYSP